MKALVIGNGGREHALSWRIAQSPSIKRVFCAPGNPGTHREPKVKNVTLPSKQDIVQFCVWNRIDYVVIGPEQHIVDGLVDHLMLEGIPVWGPSAAASKLESSKTFTKAMCDTCNIPTASYGVFTDVVAAKFFIIQEMAGKRVVVKADGLAAGKGVVVAKDTRDAFDAIDDMLIKGVHGSAGAKVIIEEFMEGTEASFFALVDGETIVPCGVAKDNKAIGEGGTGPNTGGMGTISPVPGFSTKLQDQVMREIIYPTARYMAARGTPFKGTLFAGLMIDPINDKARLIEYNVRFGDPETQSLMALYSGDFGQDMALAAAGKLDQVRPEFAENKAAATVVVATRGYPETYKKGTVIKGLENVEAAGVKVFHAGTTERRNGDILANGGRVLNVTGVGANLAEARAKAYGALRFLDWDDAYFRRDI